MPLRLVSLLISAALAASSTAALAAPGALWVAPLGPDRGLAEAVATGATLRDRLPDAVVLDDAAAAARLGEAGFAPEGPFVPDPAAEIFLVRHHAADTFAGPPASPDIDWTAPGVRVLWSRGGEAVVQAVDGLPADRAYAHAHRQVLSSRPLRWPDRAPAPDFRRGTTEFAPEIDSIVAAVDSALYDPWILDLAGAAGVTVGGSPHTFTTRYTHNSQCDLAEQYAYEAFQAMGYTVEYDDFNVQSTTARNVIATLPGSVTPENVYIFCGHLDSTSPLPNSSARGANDNASGSAAVLAGADILRDYEFESTIRFILFTGEEQGLYGSQHYVLEALSNGDNILGVINCDMIAWYGSRYRVDIEGELFADDFMSVMADACAEFTGLGSAKVYGAWGSDHVPFLNQGIPTFLAIESDYASYPCYHQTCDTASQNKVGFGVEITQACLATLAHAAGVVSTTDAIEVPPGRLQLQARPNPFRDGTTIRFRLEEAGHVRLAVHDVTGREQRRLLDGRLDAGAHERAWSGRGARGTQLPSGVYYLRFEARKFSATERLIITR